MHAERRTDDAAAAVTEEVSGRLEPVLATGVGRHRWLAGHMLIAGFGTALILNLTGIAGGLTYGAITGRWAEGGR